MAHQRLQHRLQVPRRQPVPGGERLRGHRPAPRMQRDVDHGSNGQNAFARQELHENIWGCEEELSHD